MLEDKISVQTKHTRKCVRKNLVKQYIFRCYSENLASVRTQGTADHGKLQLCNYVEAVSLLSACTDWVIVFTTKIDYFYCVGSFVLFIYV